ncbi:EAL and GGDEF domain-containing protein [Thiomicrorhabdus sp. ZW0627]|uniref:GGDEF domain-containing protein n=1 Tax=Thiomicrorhabdus sp. ZW0627 TaxID=3039774 RepID=UPI002436A0AA|nr:EAL and GGDEF domain-containing protein [Thiomicrorhabdus sp. ZW0627]MDG6773766.1 EAL and GGDEF domain-containing protein [Thiomicrorhabdus sp. ZW0627]
MVECSQFEVLPVNEQLKHRLSDSSLGRELLSIFTLKNLTPVYQPIVDIQNRKVFGFEALSRGPENSPLYWPLHLFHVAEEHGCLFEMDLLARQIAIESYHQFDKNEYLFVNVTVNALMQSSHRRSQTLDCLQSLGIDVSQVVIEITELQPVEDFDLFIQSINHYRHMGFKVAIDDLGGGYNGLRIWSEVKPDFVKIDKHFIFDLAENKDKQRFIETICALAKGLHTKVIAEGVEDEKTLKALEKIGVDYVQGYLFKKPQPEPTLNLDYVWSNVVETDLRENETAACLVRETPSILPELPVSEITELFLQKSELDYVPVVEDGLVLGMVWRREVMDLFASRFGRDLHQRKPVKKIMDKSPVTIDVQMPLVELSRIVTEYEGSHRGDVFIITKNKQYQGCGCFIDLLRAMTDLKVQSAQYANPLSGLPGNVPIQNTIRSFLSRQIDFMVIYIDMDHFKPFNDFYSFERGDDIIRSMTKILHHHTKESTDFIGHIGGDDFIIISPRVKKYQSICEGVLHEFRQVVPSYYDDEDRKRGAIKAVDRDGKERHFPMISLSLGVLLVAPGMFSHQQMLTSYATQAKKKAKSEGGNTYSVIDSKKLNLVQG